MYEDYDDDEECDEDYDDEDVITTEVSIIIFYTNRLLTVKANIENWFSLFLPIKGYKVIYRKEFSWFNVSSPAFSYIFLKVTKSLQFAVL